MVIHIETHSWSTYKEQETVKYSVINKIVVSSHFFPRFTVHLRRGSDRKMGEPEVVNTCTNVYLSDTTAHKTHSSWD